MKPLQKERDATSKRLADVQWDIQQKGKRIKDLEQEIKDLKELKEFLDKALSL